MDKIQSTEALAQTWYRPISDLSDLQALLDEIDTYQHNSITTVHAIAAPMLALGRFVFSRHEVDVGVANRVLWAIIDRFGVLPQGTPKRLQEFSALLDPRMEHQFNRLPKSAVQWARSEASRRLISASMNTPKLLIMHWKRLVDGGSPFNMSVDEKS